ncbi:MAG TPA: plastocyanin/azurin family copper-binding protein [Gemmataceae bacterium]|jgi:plastocyanin
MRVGKVARLVTAAAAIAVIAIAAVGAASGHEAKVAPKVVQVKDDLYTPVSVSLVKGHSVKWKWVNTIHTHNVRLNKAPAGVKKSNFASQNSSSPTYTFTRKFTKVGTYHFICSIHPTKMQMDVKVHN